MTSMDVQITWLNVKVKQIGHSIVKKDSTIFFPFYQYYDIIIFLRKGTISQVSVVVHTRLGFLFIFLYM